MVAQSAVNRCVTGSSPVSGAKIKNGFLFQKGSRESVFVLKTFPPIPRRKIPPLPFIYI